MALLERTVAKVYATRAWEEGHPEELQALGTPAEREMALDLERCTPGQQQVVRQLVAAMVAGNAAAQTHSKPPEDSDAPAAGGADPGREA